MEILTKPKNLLWQPITDQVAGFMYVSGIFCGLTSKG